MEKVTNEKSLMVVQDNFLKKIKNFFVRFFWSKDEEVECKEVENKEKNNKKIDMMRNQDLEQKERRLYNFDADNNDEWPENVNVENQLEEQQYQQDQQIQDNNDEQDSEYEREPISEVCREKEELEQKLRNYYASITKMNN